MDRLDGSGCLNRASGEKERENEVDDVPRKQHFVMTKAPFSQNAGPLRTNRCIVIAIVIVNLSIENYGSGTISRLLLKRANMTSSLTCVSSTEWQQRRNEDDVMIPCRQGYSFGSQLVPNH
jgi:hypothetical protein